MGSLSWSSEPSRPGETRDHSTPQHYITNQTRPHQDEPSSPSPDQSQSRLSLPPAAGREECSQVPGRHFPLTWRLSLGQSPGPEILPALSWDPRGRHPLQHWQASKRPVSDNPSILQHLQRCLSEHFPRRYENLPLRGTSLDFRLHTLFRGLEEE